MMIVKKICKKSVLNITLSKNLIFRRWFTYGYLTPNHGIFHAEHAMNYYIKFFKWEYKKYKKL